MVPTQCSHLGLFIHFIVWLNELGWLASSQDKELSYPLVQYIYPVNTIMDHHTSELIDPFTSHEGRRIRYTVYTQLLHSCQCQCASSISFLS